jgi:hypothetical protein
MSSFEVDEHMCSSGACVGMLVVRVVGKTGRGSVQP